MTHVWPAVAVAPDPAAVSSNCSPLAVVVMAMPSSRFPQVIVGLALAAHPRSEGPCLQRTVGPVASDESHFAPPRFDMGRAAFPCFSRARHGDQRSGLVVFEAPP